MSFLLEIGSYRVFPKESYFESTELKLFLLFVFATLTSLLNHQTEDAIMDLILRSVGKVIKVFVSHDLLQSVESPYHLDNRNFLVSFLCQVSLSRLSSPRAESARAVTGRRCPHSGRGENFLSRQPDFFTETAVTPERKVEKSFPRWEINRHIEG